MTMSACSLRSPAAISCATTKRPRWSPNGCCSRCSACALVSATTPLLPFFRRPWQPDRLDKRSIEPHAASAPSGRQTNERQLSVMRDHVLEREKPDERCHHKHRYRNFL